jgi:methionyl-tRNA formyltransferase
MSAPLQVVFMGTAELSHGSLEALLAAEGLHVIAVVTQPDRPSGRDMKVRPSPVKELAQRHNLPVLQPERARDPAFIEQLRTFTPDIIAVAAYGQILPSEILDLPRLGCVNVHTSLLPRYRGASPIQAAIINGDAETGVTIMKIDLGMDTGDILSQEKTGISSEDTAESLHDRLAVMGADLLVRTIRDYAAGKIPPEPQPAEGVVMARKIRKEDGHIDWQQSARSIWNRVRGFAPWPGAFAYLPSGEAKHLLKIWKAEVVQGKPSAKPGEILEVGKTGVLVACGEGALRILEVQREGGRRMGAQDFLAGHPLQGGQVLF